MDPPKPGDAIAAAYLNALASGAEAFSALRVGGGLRLKTTAGVPTLSLGRTRPFLARLTSQSGYLYGWQEVYYDKATNAFPNLNVGSVGTPSFLPAVDINRATDIPVGPSSGSVVELTPAAAGQWYTFDYHRWRVIPPCTLTIRCLMCCGVPAPGATVTLTQNGQTVRTCTTGSNGTCSISYPGNGTYTVTGTLSGCGTASQTFTANPCTNNITLNLCDFPHTTLHCSLTIVTPQIDINGNLVSPNSCPTNPGGVNFNQNVFYGAPCCSTQNVNTTLAYLGLLPCYGPNGQPTGVSVPTWRSPILSGVSVPAAIVTPGQQPGFFCWPVCAVNLACGCGPQLTLILSNLIGYPCSNVDNTKTAYFAYSFQGASGSTCNPLLLNFSHATQTVNSGVTTIFFDNTTAVVTS